MNEFGHKIYEGIVKSKYKQLFVPKSKYQSNLKDIERLFVAYQSNSLFFIQLRENNQFVKCQVTDSQNNRTMHYLSYYLNNYLLFLLFAISLYIISEHPKI